VKYAMGRSRFAAALRLSRLSSTGGKSQEDKNSYFELRVLGTRKCPRVRGGGEREREKEGGREGGKEGERERGRKRRGEEKKGGKGGGACG